MSKSLIIKGPDGRLVAAPAHVLKGTPGAYEVDPSKLKPGWTVAKLAEPKPAEPKRA